MMFRSNYIRKRPRSFVDPFAELVSLLQPSAVLWKTIEAHGHWALRFEQNTDVNFGIVLKGSCLLIPEAGVQKTIGPGDFLLQSRPDTYVVASDTGLIAKSGEAVLARSRGRKLRVGNGSSRRVEILAGHFSFDDVNHDLLMGFLPRLVHLQAESASAKKVASLLAFTAEEASAQRPAGSIIVQHAMEIILIEILRDHSKFSIEDKSGLIAGLADPLLKIAFMEFHAAPEAEWTVARLSQVAGISRTIFAEKFRDVVGITPMEYLLKWRMALAKDRLRHSTESLQEIASAVGYKSASSFSTAFSHRFGCSPKEFRRGRVVS